jgi:hypothetical protein
MHDPTEETRKAMLLGQQTILAEFTDEQIEEDMRKGYPDACNTKELQEQYRVTSFLAPFVSVVRRSDGVKGTLRFIHQPRIYYGFQEV